MRQLWTMFFPLLAAVGLMFGAYYWFFSHSPTQLEVAVSGKLQ